MWKLVLGASAVALGTLLAPAYAADDTKLPTDQQFLTKAIECNVGEIKMAEIALQRAANPKVKELAQKLRDDHTKCLKELTELAGAQKVTVTRELSKECKECAEKLSKLEGKAFDEEYLRAVIEGHEKAIAACQNQAKEGKIEEIRAMSKENLPKLKEHLELAKKVQQAVKG